MANFSVNLTSIEKKFPKKMTVPPLLKAFGQWVAKQPRGSLGYFEVMAGGKFRDDSLSKEANKTIADATGIFMLFGEGSELALWNHGDGPPAVVLIDSEGQNRTVASSLEAFLTKVAKRDTDTELDGDGDDDDVPQKHKELAAWLKTKKVTAAKRTAPDFGKWVTKLSKVDAPPKAGGLPAPPKDMAARGIASIGKKANDPKLAALLAELGIDLKNYKTADAQRHLYVPKHGYKLQFEKGTLKALEFTAAKHESWDYVNSKHASFEAFPFEIFKGVKITDSLAVMKKKLGKPVKESEELGTYYWDLPGNVRFLVSVIAPDDEDEKIPPGGISYIYVGAKK